MSDMQQRVQCQRCQAHRDLALTPTGVVSRCFVCGGESYEHVHESPGDRAVKAIAAAEAEVIAAAEQIDRALYSGVEMANGYRCAVRLSEACRQLALARAGVVP